MPKISEIEEVIIDMTIHLKMNTSREFGMDEYTPEQVEEMFRSQALAMVKDPRKELTFWQEGDSLEDHIKAIENPITVYGIVRGSLEKVQLGEADFNEEG